MSEQSQNKVVIEAAADAPILLPDDPSYLTAEYVRDGADLVIETADGGVTVISGYFNHDAPVDLIVAGAKVSGQVVGALARPRKEEVETEAQEQMAEAPSSAAHSAETASTEIGQPIGKIGEISGEAFAKRADGSVVSLKAGDPVYEDDVLSTSDGSALGVVFTDGMTFSLGAEARMVLDEFSYDEAAHEGGGLFSVLAGEFSFVSGKAAHTAEDALMIETPTMTIGVRGTKVVSQIDADGVSRVALLAEEDGTVGKIMVMTDAGEQLIDAANKMVEIADRSQPPSAQKEIGAAEVVQFFGEAVEALPAPHEFFTPKVDAPHVAPAAPFAAGRQASAEAQAEAVEAELAIAAAEAETSFAERAEAAAEQTSAQSAAAVEAEAPAADFTLVARRLQSLAEEAAVNEPQAFIEAVEQQASSSEAVQEALAEAREIAEAAAEAATEQAEAALAIEAANAARAAAANAGLSVSVAENAADTDVIHDMGGTAASYALADTHGGLFEVDPASGQVSLATGRSLDFESQSSYTLNVEATAVDGTVSTQRINLSVTDVNDSAPVFTAGSAATANVAESSSDAHVIHSAAATDADSTGETLSYQISEDASGLFEVDAQTGAVSLKNGVSLDYEATQTYSISVQVSDGTHTSLQVVTINVTDDNEFSVSAVGDVDANANTVNEGASTGDSASIQALATDADGSNNAVTYTLTDDAGGRFVLIGDQVSVADGTLLDYEDAASHTIEVTATSADGSSATQSFTIDVADIAEAVQLANGGQAFIDLGVSEISITGGDGDDTIDAADGDDLVAGGAGDDVIDGGDGADIAQFSGNWADYTITESGGVYTVTDDRVDGPDGTDMVSNVETFRFADGDVAAADVLNAGPSGVDDAGAISEGAASISGDVLANDSDANIAAGVADSLSVAAVSHETGAVGQAVSGSYGAVTIDADGSYSYALNNADASVQALGVGESLTDSFVYTVVDAHGVSSTATLTITIGGTNDAPVITSNGGGATGTVSIAENTASVGTVAASDVDAGATASYSIIGGADAALFQIDPASGALSFISAPDFETSVSAAGDHSFEVTVQVVDQHGATDSQTLTVTVTDVNEHAVSAPADGDGAANSVYDDAVDGSVVGVTAQASDADGSNNGVTYALSDDAGGRFAIDPVTGVVTVANSGLLDNSASASQDIVVEATSEDGSSDSSTFTINVAAADYAPQTLYGTAGADALSSASGDDVIYARAGDDVVHGGNGDDALYGENGDDTITGGAGDDVIDGGNDSDTAVFSGDYADYSFSYNMGTGEMTVDGPDGVDTVSNVEFFQFDDHTVSEAVIIASLDSAQQTLTGTNADDVLIGGAGADVISGGNGQDALYGNAGDDTIMGGNGVDWIHGGDGDDTLGDNGGDNGGDTFIGGAGDDAIDGGNGNDTAVFSGDYADYAFSYNGATSVLTVTGPDGVDDLSNIETLQFDDQSVAVSSVVSSLAAGNTDPTIALAGAVTFDGSNDYVDMGDQDALDPGTGDMTVEAWFYYDGSAAGDQAIVSKGNEGDAKIGYSIRIVDDELVLRLNADNTGDDSGTAAVSQNLTTPGWYHVAMVIQQSTGSLKGYLNGSDAGFSIGHAGSGVADNTFTAPGEGVNATESFMLGANDEGGSPGEFFDGQVSDVRVWSTARGAAEISADMNKVMDGSEAGLVAQWAPGAGDSSLTDTVGAVVGSLVGGASAVDPNNVTLGGDGTVTGRIALSDADGDALTILDGAGPSKGSVSIDRDTGVWTYTVNGDEEGSDSFSYQVSDGHGGLSSLSVTVSLGD